MPFADKKRGIRCDVGPVPNEQAWSAMHESERLSQLIGNIYDAVLDPTLWVDVLGRTRAYIGGWAIAPFLERCGR